MAQGPRKGKMKASPKAKTVAYTPLTEKQKNEAMENLIKKLNDPKDPASLDTSGMGTRMNISDRN